MKNCLFCGVEILSPVCAKCGGPQPVAPGEDYFSLLEVKRGFKQDLPSLEKRFYEISRMLHPDRFAAGIDKKWKVISVERMSAVNRAYQTLTKRDALRSYLLELEGLVKPEGSVAEKPEIPSELAEEWFSLQDAVMETPTSAVNQLAAFGSDLKKRADDLKARIRNLEDQYDAGEGRAESLRLIEKLVLDGQYLRSMERDLLRLKSRLGLE